MDSLSGPSWSSSALSVATKTERPLLDSQVDGYGWRERKLPDLPRYSTYNAEPILVSRTQKLWHSLGLGSIYLLIQELRGFATIEGRKVIIINDFRTACYVALLHILPAFASITLAAFNFRGYYIGGELSGSTGEDSMKLLGLQLTAKALELLSVASLSCILFAIIRHQLLCGRLPFGAVTAGFEFSKLSFLWSKEFVSTWGANFASIKSKAFLLAAISVFSIIGATIGPAAAVTSQPVLRNWPAGGTEFYLNTTMEELYPSKLSEMSAPQLPCYLPPDKDCFPSNVQVLADELLSNWPTDESGTSNLNPKLMPENVLISGRHALRNLATRFRGEFVYQPPLTAATVPMGIISDTLAKVMGYWTVANTGRCHENKEAFCFYNDIFFSADAKQPVAFASCLSNDIGSPIRFPDINPRLKDQPPFEIDELSLKSKDSLDEITSNGTTPGLRWVALPVSKSTSIGAIITLRGAEVSNSVDKIIACSVDARWGDSTVVGSFQRGPRLIFGSPLGWFDTGRFKTSSKNQLTWPQVTISPSWAQSLNPIMDKHNTTAFDTLAGSVGRQGDVTLAPASINAVEAILSLMIVEGMSRTSSLTTIQGSLKSPVAYEWAGEMVPRHGFGNGGSAFSYSPVDGDDFVKLHMRVAVNGYGYGLSTATLLSSLVLLVYAFIAITYVACTLWTSKTSTTWESFSEMLALAINSRPTEALRSTGAGIHSLRTLEESVSIGVRDEHLEMIFHDECTQRDYDTGYIGRVKSNLHYD